MLDKTSKRIISYIRSFEDITWHYNRGYDLEGISFAEFIAALEYLESNGYVSGKKIPTGWISATLTHKGLHAKEFNSIAVKRYLLDKWIDFLSMVIAIIAVIISIIALLQ